MATSFVNESKPVIVKTTDRYGDTYEGEFTFKIKLSTADRFRQDQLFRDYIGANPDQANESARALAFMLSQINVRVVSAPIIWTSKRLGLDLSSDFIEAVFAESIKPESDFIDARNKKAETDRARLRADREAEKREEEELEKGM